MDEQTPVATGEPTATLHLLNRSSHEHHAWQDLVAALGEQDRVLLIEDGVLSLTRLPEPLAALGERLHALQEDLASRGMGDIETSAMCVDMDGFVALTERCQRIISWF